MKETPKANLAEIVTTTARLIGEHKIYAGVLFFIMLAQAFAESMGISMVVPLLSLVIETSAPNQAIFGIINRIINLSPEKWKLLFVLAIMCGLVGTKSLMAILNDIFSNKFIWLLREEWSSRIFQNYLQTSVKKFSTQKQGVLINNVIVEPQLASKSVKFILEVLSKIIISSFLLFVLLQANWKITLSLILLGLIAFILTMKRTYSFSMKVGKKLLGLNQECGAVVAEGFSAVKSVKAYGVEQSMVTVLSKKMRSFSKTKVKFTIISNLPINLAETAIAVAMAGFLFYYGYILKADLREIIPIVGLFAFVAVKIMSQASFIISKRMEIVSFMPSMKMIYELMNQQEEKELLEKGEEFRTIETDIHFQNVVFSYTPGHFVFENLNLIIPKDKLTAIAGPSGMGKSTIAELLMRLLIPDKGEITVNGKNISDYSLKSWRSKIGYVSQEPYLINLSIRENIKLGKPSASQEEIEEAAKTANAHSFIMNLPMQYDTPCGDRGQALSGGQRQRVAIARALVRNPEILIFDEATSSLDSESEQLIRESIEKLAKKKTVLIIAHRLSTIQKADLIYKVEGEGKVRKVEFEELK